MRVLLRITRYLRPYWRRALVGYVGLAGSTALSLVVPWLLQQAIDLGLGASPAGDGPSRALAGLGLAVAAVAVVKGLFSFAQRYLTEWLGHRVGYDLRNALYDRIQHLSFSYHDYAQTGQLMSRCTSDVLAVQQFAGTALMEAATIVLLLGGIVTILFLTSARLAVIALLPMPVLLVFAVHFGRVIHPRFRAVQQTMGEMTTVLQESLVGVQVVKAFAHEPYETERFGVQSWRNRDRRMHAMAAFARYQPLTFFLIGITTPLILWFGGRQVMAGTLTLGTLVAFQTYVALLALPVQRLTFLVNMAAEALASGERIFEVLDQEPEIRDTPTARPLTAVQGIVRFEGVSFQYEARALAAAATADEGSRAKMRHVLRDIDLVAHPGEVVALLGHTGSGKSTITHLIPRFYDVSAGRVTIDGHDVRAVTLESLRHHIGIVQQDPLLFSATIGENIAYGRPDATPDQIVAAARAAQAHDFILEFPKSYDTLVGERGVTLSGGQRQRVAIARALLLDPRILILDDSTSSVDTETEYLIRQALAALMAGRTTFVIAQRLQTVMQADQILVLHQGRIAERAQTTPERTAHEALLARGGLYRDIYDLQLRDQERLRRELAAAAVWARGGGR